MNLPITAGVRSDAPNPSPASHPLSRAITSVCGYAALDA